MRRLCTEGLCSYSGRSVRRAIGVRYGSRTEAHAERRGDATGPWGGRRERVREQLRT